MNLRFIAFSLGLFTLSTVSFADCYRFLDGQQTVEVGWFSKKSYSADTLCINGGNYLKSDFTPTLSFELRNGEAVVGNYVASSDRYSGNDVRFTLADGEPEPTQFDARYEGNALTSIKLAGKWKELEQVSTNPEEEPKETYSLVCADANLNAVPYRVFEVTFSNAQGPALGQDTKISLAADTNDYYGAEMSSGVQNVAECQELDVQITQENYSAQCAAGSKSEVSLNLVSNYGLAFGQITLSDTKLNVICRSINL